MENVFVGGDGLGQMQNTYYLECAKIKYWYVIISIMVCYYWYLNYGMLLSQLSQLSP